MAQPCRMFISSKENLSCLCQQRQEALPCHYGVSSLPGPEEGTLLALSCSTLWASAGVIDSIYQRLRTERSILVYMDFTGTLLVLCRLPMCLDLRQSLTLLAQPPGSAGFQRPALALVRLWLYLYPLIHGNDPAMT